MSSESDGRGDDPEGVEGDRVHFPSPVTKITPEAIRGAKQTEPFCFNRSECIWLTWSAGDPS